MGQIWTTNMDNKYGRQIWTTNMDDLRLPIYLFLRLEKYFGAAIIVGLAELQARSYRGRISTFQPLFFNFLSRTGFFFTGNNPRMTLIPVKLKKSWRIFSTSATCPKLKFVFQLFLL
jgi:hypothetical protein